MIMIASVEIQKGATTLEPADEAIEQDQSSSTPTYSSAHSPHTLTSVSSMNLRQRFLSFSYFLLCVQMNHEHASETESWFPNAIEGSQWSKEMALSRFNTADIFMAMLSLKALFFLNDKY